jgi:hypothetical protein
MTDLTKITTPIGLLDDETQKALMKHLESGGSLEVFTPHGWESAWRKRFSWAETYRAAPARQLEIPWHVIKDEFQWAAMDVDGAVWCYTVRPELCEDYWIPSDYHRVASLKALKIDTTGIDWRQSLTRRPE